MLISNFYKMDFACKRPANFGKENVVAAALSQYALYDVVHSVSVGYIGGRGFL